MVVNIKIDNIFSLFSYVAIQLYVAIATHIVKKRLYIAMHIFVKLTVFYA